MIIISVTISGLIAALGSLSRSPHTRDRATGHRTSACLWQLSVQSSTRWKQKPVTLPPPFRNSFSGPKFHKLEGAIYEIWYKRGGRPASPGRQAW